MQRLKKGREAHRPDVCRSAPARRTFRVPPPPKKTSPRDPKIEVRRTGRAPDAVESGQVRQPDITQTFERTPAIQGTPKHRSDEPSDIPYLPPPTAPLPTKPPTRPTAEPVRQPEAAEPPTEHHPEAPTEATPPTPEVPEPSPIAAPPPANELAEPKPVRREPTAATEPRVQPTKPRRLRMPRGRLLKGGLIALAVAAALGLAAVAGVFAYFSKASPPSRHWASTSPPRSRSSTMPRVASSGKSMRSVATWCLST